MGSELVHSIRQEMATPQLPLGHPKAARRCFGGCRQGCATDPQFLSPTQAANNLIVLGREEAGAERIFQNNGVSLLLQLIETKNAELILAAVRTLSGMCTGHKARVSNGMFETFAAIALHLGEWKTAIVHDVCEQQGKN